MSTPGSEHERAERSHSELRVLLGAYVLGGLDSADRDRLDEHLPRCQECSAELAEFEGVPGLLALAADGERTAAEPEPAADSVRGLLAAARHRRARTRRLAVFAVAAAVLVVAALGGVVWLANQPDSEQPGTALVAATSLPGSYDSAAASGRVLLERRSWGTEIHLTMSYPPGQADTLTAWVVSEDGIEEVAANWAMPPDGQCTLVGASSIHRDSVVTIEIRNADGVTLMRAAV